MTVRIRTRRLTWRAARNGLAHASEGSQPRALCGTPTVLERMAWPTLAKCPLCQALAV